MPVATQGDNQMGSDRAAPPGTGRKDIKQQKGMMYYYE